jgi:hypothetical protein
MDLIINFEEAVQKVGFSVISNEVRNLKFNCRPSFGQGSTLFVLLFEAVPQHRQSL